MSITYNLVRSLLTEDHREDHVENQCDNVEPCEIGCLKKSVKVTVNVLVPFDAKFFAIDQNGEPVWSRSEMGYVEGVDGSGHWEQMKEGTETEVSVNNALVSNWKIQYEI